MGFKVSLSQVGDLVSKKGKRSRAWAIAQSVNYLPCKHEALSLIPRIHKKELRMVVHSIPGLGKQSREDSWSLLTR